ncbi:SET domain-containing protein [Rickenella mellea]|uniref:Ribosomal lysine N-methyltransferase 4 n=1 Tax=Rickenella mellea TaxID=50990 RepID=A0A4Y7QFP4_9AGAM|nr:SET domain-containing protein [Rickenella mellea]
MDELVTWFQANGGFWDSNYIGLTTFPESGRGAPNHTLFAIPRSLTLSSRTSNLPQIFGQRAWRHFRLDKGWAGLILCMMWEDARTDSSKWSSYLSSMPTSFDTLMFWNEDELKELQGTTIVDKIGKADAEREYHEKIVPAIKVRLSNSQGLTAQTQESQSREDLFHSTLISSHYSIDRYHIMGSCVLSRSFQVEQWDGVQPEDKPELNHAASDMDVDEGTQLHDTDHDLEGSEEHKDESDDDEDDTADVSMVPMADMLNARYESENAKLFYEEKELKMVTTRAIAKGEQIWNTYGNLPNADLLRRYGHIDILPFPGGEEGNPADVVEVLASLVVEIVLREGHGTDSALKERIDWWLEEGGEDVFVIEMDHVIPDDFVSLTKLLMSSTQEWEKARDKGRPPKPKLDAQVLPILLATLEARLRLYSSTIEVDKEIMDQVKSGSISLSLKKCQAIMVRLAEKKILDGAMLGLKATGGVIANRNRDSGKRKRTSDGAGELRLTSEDAKKLRH